MNKKTLVLGASLHEMRYSNMAIKKLRLQEIPVVAIGLRKGTVVDVEITAEKKDFKNIDTITLCLNAAKQKDFYNYVLELNPKRVIFNPGTENLEFVKLLKQNNIASETACTLVLLSTNQY